LLGCPFGQVVQHIGQGQNIGILLMHVEQVDGMRRFMAVKDALSTTIMR